MTNKYRPHILVLPEDDAERQLANGFILDPGVDQRRIQVLPPAGGWLKVLESFEKDHVADLRRCPYRVLVMVIDFDERENRLAQTKSRIAADLQDRVFLLGACGEPEDIKRALRDIGSLEVIGTALAEECRTDARSLWNRPELVWNVPELKRLNAAVKPWLFR